MGKSIITKAVPGYEGLYEINTIGQVFSLFYHNKPRRYQLNSYPDKDGYEKVTLRKNGKPFNTGVHRLVAKAFIPNPDSLPQVNHRDLQPSNNRLENLEWCTCKENIRYSWNETRRKSTEGEGNNSTKLNKNEVIAIWMLKDKLPPVEIGKLFDISNKVIWTIHNQTNWKWLTDTL